MTSRKPPGSDDLGVQNKKRKLIDNNSSGIMKVEIESHEPAEENLSSRNVAHSISDLGGESGGAPSRESMGTTHTIEIGVEEEAMMALALNSHPKCTTRDSNMENGDTNDDDLFCGHQKMRWDAEIGESFFLRQPITGKELELVVPKVKSEIQEPLALLGEKGYELYREWRKKSARTTADTKTENERVERALKDAKVDGTPRKYQQRLFEIACQQNTIVHLGTGAGKTLIALMVIRHFASDFQRGKQTLFMVPSVALAIQQSTGLQANLPYSVQVACYTVNTTLRARQELQKCNILVATHGAILDLLMHYGDLFSMDRFNLVVVDECHYAFSNHAYATLMNRFYHTLPLEKRPRVLGLTASPLVKARPTHTEENLVQMLSALEGTLDAKVVSYGGLEPEGPVDQAEDEAFVRKAAKESHVLYNTYLPLAPLPSAQNITHPSRKKEIQQLFQLYDDLGPLAVSIYCQTLAKEVSRNTFERESSKDYHKFVAYFHRVSEFCDQLCQGCPHGGRSDKLMALEELLEDQIEDHGGAETVGLVFVERRITALALNDYFRFRKKHIDNDNWIRAKDARKLPPKSRGGVIVPLSAQVLASSTLEGNSSKCNMSQFEDAEDDLSIPVHLPVLSTTKKHAMKDLFADADYDTSDEFEQYFQSIRAASMPEPSIAATKWTICDGTINQYSASVADAWKEGHIDTTPKDLSDAQFEDAESSCSEKESVGHCEEKTLNECSMEASKESIRCQALVRNATQIFKSLNMSRKSIRDEEEIKQSWLHQEMKIRDVLSGLRRGEINLLIATSVVEEGVDVQACSFVVVFDSLKSTKGYIQMKGRARQKDAKFFVFQNVEERSKTVLSLDSAQKIERRVSHFIASRASIDRVRNLVPTESSQPTSDVDDDELWAVEQGKYEAKHGTVDFFSAKSLVNRYVLSLPIDPIVRASKASFLAHLPSYAENRLDLPSHLPASIRTVTLPDQYLDYGSKQKEKILALMACVRLHKNSLLNDRLLPLSHSDLQAKMLQVVTEEPRRIPVRNMACSSIRKLIVFPLYERNDRIDKLHSILGTEGHILAVMSTCQLDEVPPMRVWHNVFGSVTCVLGTPFDLHCTDGELQVILSFFKLMMDCRWRRRTKNVYFRAKHELSVLIPPYFVGCLNMYGEVDWAKMTELISECQRSETERIEAVRCCQSQGLPAPRLWTPLYAKYFTYISYGPSGKTCAANFPKGFDREGVETYQDYFTKCRGYYVEEECPLFDAQRLWVLPFGKKDGDENSALKKSIIGPHSSRYAVSEELKSLLLPKTACMEARMADPNFLLLSTHLPQFLYHMQRYMTAASFIKHCYEHMPRLGKCLSTLPLERIAEALTAKSSAEYDSYEKLEWFGDAVLKLIQTDSLLQSKDLCKWIEFLHEGDLSVLRSVMGCNERLALACKNLNLNEFILTSPLGRGQWAPATLELYVSEVRGIDTGKGVAMEDNVPKKTCADVIESLLGLVFLTNGYDEAKAVGDELQVTLPRTEQPWIRHDLDIPPNSQLLDTAASFTGQEKFHRHELVEEAFTHPTAMHSVTPSYQKLEWIGDAVLCLAVRDWIFKTFPNASLGQMVAMEASLVANETLAFLSLKNNLLKNLNHCDQSLPGRIEHYEWCTQELGRGLWGTDPPKVAADVVESLIGAVYMDSGFAAAMEAVIRIVSPMLKILQQMYAKNERFVMMHPRKAMQEIGGSLFVMKVAKEEKFAAQDPDTEVWFGKSWGKARPDGQKFIGTVRCVGHILVAVADASAEVAGNRACAFAVEMLRKDADLLEEIKILRTSMERARSSDTEYSTTEESMESGKDDGVEYENESGSVCFATKVRIFTKDRRNAVQAAEDEEAGDIIV